MPSGNRVAWLAICLPASRYFRSRAGDIACPAPVLVNPSPAALSPGNSRAGSRATPVRSRTVKVYSALLSRRSTTGPGSPDRASASEYRYPLTHSTSTFRWAAPGCRAALGGISPFLSISRTPCQARVAPRTSSSWTNRSRSSSPSFFFVEWQPMQNCFSNGRTRAWYDLPSDTKLWGTAFDSASADTTSTRSNNRLVLIRGISGTGLHRRRTVDAPHGTQNPSPDRTMAPP